MSTSQTVTSNIPDDVKAQLEAALNNLVGGIRDPEQARLACERMDRRREANRELFGEQNVAVELIRATRDRQ